MILLLGCQPPPVEPPLLPSVDLNEATAAWGAADLPGAWADATAGGWPVPQTVLDAYLDFLAQGDSECPGTGLELDDSVLLGCTAASGYTYAGISSWYEQDEPELAFRALHADMRLTSPDGLALLVGGTVYEMQEGGVRTESFEGTFVWEGDPGPFGGGVSGFATRVSSAGDLTLNGGLAFGGLAIEADALTVSADGTAVGALGLRDPVAGWHDVVFDGAACGHAGADEVCLDLSPLAGR